MRLVEIISGLNSSQATLEAAAAFAAAIGKTSVLVKKDSPGFIVNRLLIPYMNEAARLLSEGAASVEDIDTAVKLGLNHPMGPFELLDMGGVELAITILNYFREGIGSGATRAQYLLKQMARAGKKGRNPARASTSIRAEPARRSRRTKRIRKVGHDPHEAA